MEYFLAIDIGASSGRHIIGYYDEKKQIQCEEVYRFKNDFKHLIESLTWDVEYLYTQVVEGIKIAFKRYPQITSLSIDTWGVDYVLLNEDKVIEPVFAYRDKRTANRVLEVHEKISFDELYQITGCQFQPFNTIYQLYDDLQKGRLKNATDFLLIPEYLMYRLTGIKTKEYTNASTTGLMDAYSKAYSNSIIKALGLPSRLFTKLYQPGHMVGALLPEIAKEVNGNLVVILCATHDTASAVASLDIDENTLYLSSGTWSLLGVKRATPLTSIEARQQNFSNEAGPDYIRFQKNIMGLWLIQCLEKETGIPIPTLVQMAKESHYEVIVDVNDERFLSPESIRFALKGYAIENGLPLPANYGDYANCIFHSLAKSYKDTIQEIEDITFKKYSKIIIIGGGAKNDYLNELTKQYTKLTVVAHPIEATAIGNLRVQMEVQNDEK